MDRVYNIEHTRVNEENMAREISEKLEKKHAAQKLQYDKSIKLKDVFSDGDWVVIADTRQIVGQEGHFNLSI